MHKKAKKGVGQSKNFGKFVYRSHACRSWASNVAKDWLGRHDFDSLSFENSQPCIGWETGSNDCEAKFKFDQKLRFLPWWRLCRSYSEANRAGFLAHHQRLRADVERDSRETSEGQVITKSVKIMIFV